MVKLQGKFALVTGASLGLGKTIAKSFVQQGASVCICARNEEDLKRSEQELILEAKDGQHIFAQVADVARQDDVDSLIDMIIQKFGRIDILVNNAAIYGPKGCLEDVNWQEWIKTYEVNVFGTIYLCRSTLPYFKKQRYGKIINVSGAGASNLPYPRFSAYATAKAALNRFTETLAEEVKEFSIDVNAIAPGPLNTRFLEEVLEAGPQKVGKACYDKAKQQKRDGGASLQEAAELCVYLASSESDNITGKLISVRWDPWRQLHQFKNDLLNTDIFNLRRIVPKDRNLSWGDASKEKVEG